MPLTLTITADTSEHLLRDIMNLARAPTMIGNLAATLQARQAKPSEQAAQQPAEQIDTQPVTEQNTPAAEQATTATQLVAEQVPAGEEKPEPKKTRRQKAQPTLEGVAQAQSETAAETKAAEQPKTEADPLEIPDFLRKDKPSEQPKPEYEIPGTQEDARKLCGRVIEECGPAVMEKIIRGTMKLNKFNDISVDRYGELAGLCHEALSK